MPNDKPSRKDFTRDCTSCNGTGNSSYRVRVGGWDGHNETVTQKCPICQGRGKHFNVDGYIRALEVALGGYDEGFICPACDLFTTEPHDRDEMHLTPPSELPLSEISDPVEKARERSKRFG